MPTDVFKMEQAVCSAAGVPTGIIVLSTYFTFRMNTVCWEEKKEFSDAMWGPHETKHLGGRALQT